MDDAPHLGREEVRRFLEGESHELHRPLRRLLRESAPQLDQARGAARVVVGAGKRPTDVVVRADHERVFRIGTEADDQVPHLVPTHAVRLIDHDEARIRPLLPDVRRGRVEAFGTREVSRNE